MDLIHTKEHSDRALVVRIALFCFNGRLLMLKRRHPDFEPLARVWLAQINALDRLRNEQVRHGIPPPSMADATPRVQKKKPPAQEATAPPLLTTVEATAPLLLTTTAAAPVAGASGAGSSTGDGGDCGGSVTSPIGPRRSVTRVAYAAGVRDALLVEKMEAVTLATRPAWVDESVIHSTHSAHTCHQVQNLKGYSKYKYRHPIHIASILAYQV